MINSPDRRNKTSKTIIAQKASKILKTTKRLVTIDKKLF
jgi:hypothetical protein